MPIGLPRQRPTGLPGRRLPGGVVIPAVLVTLLCSGLAGALVVGLAPSQPSQRSHPALTSAAEATSATPPTTGAPPTTAANPRLLDQQLLAARAVAARYSTLAKALAAGYTLAAPYAPGIGSHYMRYAQTYEPFDVSNPAMLLFDGDAPTSKIVGLAYYVYHNHGPPPDTFASPYAQWHQHVKVCVGPSGAHWDGDSLECRGRGQNAWMLHVWTLPSYQTPQAIFSTNCSILQ